MKIFKRKTKEEKLTEENFIDNGIKAVIGSGIRLQKIESTLKKLSADNQSNRDIIKNIKITKGSFDQIVEGHSQMEYNFNWTSDILSNMSKRIDKILQSNEKIEKIFSQNYEILANLWKRLGEQEDKIFSLVDELKELKSPTI